MNALICDLLWTKLSLCCVAHHTGCNICAITGHIDICFGNLDMFSILSFGCFEYVIMQKINDFLILLIYQSNDPNVT